MKCPYNYYPSHSQYMQHAHKKNALRKLLNCTIKVILHPTEVSVQMPDNTKTESNIFPRRCHRRHRRRLLPHRMHTRDSDFISPPSPFALRVYSSAIQRKRKTSVATKKKRIVLVHALFCLVGNVTKKHSTFPMMKCRHLKFRRNICVCGGSVSAKSFRTHERKLTIHPHHSS